MDNQEGLFAGALRRIDRRRLNEAFERCNRQADLEAYDRTALHRWLTGSIPGRREFVVRLADELDNIAVFEAWLTAQASTTATDVKAVVTRFAGLSAADKLLAFRHIRDDLIALPSSRLRTDVRMRVELHDGEPNGPYQLRMSMDWNGHLPADATTVIVTDYARLGEAFSQENCLFRDVVELDRDFLDRVRLPGDQAEQSLSFSPLGGDERTVTLAGVKSGDGVCKFGNEECEEARVRLRVAYPFPRGTAFYPIVFRGYQIAGPAQITMVMYSQTAKNPRGYAFLGPGRTWQASQLMPHELEIEVGSTGAILGEETGIVLYWSEAPTD